MSRGRTIADEMDEEEETSAPQPIRSLADVLGIRDIQDPASKDPEVPLQRVNAKSFSQEILNSRQYRESLLRRIIMDELPPAIEAKLMDYAWGRPVEKVQVEDTTKRFADYTLDQLEARAKFLTETVSTMRKQTSDTRRPTTDEDDTSIVH